MTPTADDGRFYEGDVATDRGDETLTALTATANGTAFPVADAHALVATLTISARSGTTPTLDVSLEARVGDGPWTACGALAQITAPGNTKRAFQVAGYDEARWVKTVGGTTPSFTGSIAVSKVR